MSRLSSAVPEALATLPLKMPPTNDWLVPPPGLEPPEEPLLHPPKARIATNAILMFMK
jgi:hypothetical protein